MPQLPPSIDQIRAKLRRAKEHIDQLEVEIEAYLNEAPNRALVDYDSEMAESFRRFFDENPIPLSISVLTGEALHQLRTSLDHLWCALIIRDGAIPTTASQFPIFLNKPTDKDGLKRWKAQVRGVKRVRVIALAKRCQPYRRGQRSRSHWLAILKELNNRDKHRSLVFHVVTSDPRISIDTQSRNTLGSFWGPDDGTHPIEDYIRPNGDLVNIVKVERHLIARVSLEQWGDWASPVEVVSAFKQVFLPAVTSLIASFEPYLRPRRRILSTELPHPSS